MTTVRFTVPGNPIPWERARSNGSQHFTPRRTREHKQKIQLCARRARIPTLAGPVRLSVMFYRESAQPCDIDNLSKSVQDALNGIGYADDRQIVVLSATKAIDRAKPRTEIELAEMEATPT